MINKNDERRVMAMQAQLVQDQAREAANEYVRGMVKNAPLGYYHKSELKSRWVLRYQIERRRAAGL